jgi:hypothetical protein
MRARRLEERHVQQMARAGADRHHGGGRHRDHGRRIAMLYQRRQTIERLAV